MDEEKDGQMTLKLLCVILSNSEDDSGVNHKNFRIVNHLI